MFAYYIVMLAIAVLVGPFLLLKRRARYGMPQKLGIVPEAIKEKYKSPDGVKPIWFHAVSVGEFNAAWPLLKRLNDKHPQQTIVISSTTGAGHKLALERAASFADCIYFPYDLPWCTANWLDALRPKLVTIVETEIWPGFVNQCKERTIPITMINGRMSPRSFGSYYRFRTFFGPILRNFDAIGVQSTGESERYKKVAGDNLPLQVLGNIKFDGLKPISRSEQDELLNRLNLSPDDLVFIAGSTHEGEEAAVINAFKKLPEPKRKRLIIAPRHPERFDKVADIIRLAGFRPRRFSENEKFEQEGNVYLLDAIGHLAKFYSVATVAFVGGTLTPIGGHNIVEPLTYSVPVIAGPHLHKTKDVADALKAHNALIIVQDEKELAQQLELLFNDANLREQLGRHGNEWLKESQGAVERALIMIEKAAGLNSAVPETIQVETAQGERR
ncbi:MAG: 3-deoxy-D-manno-octulosonic acid transferase [Candidatus Obscuribacterales bacterium]